MLFGSSLAVNGVLDNSRAYPQGEFTVQANASLGPLHSAVFADRTVLDVLQELRDASFQLNLTDSTLYRKIYFDVLTTESGFQFETFSDLRGTDRTTDLEFSVENSNLRGPYYVRDHNNEINAVVVKGFGRGESRIHTSIEDAERVNSSRWNRCEGFVDASQEPDETILEDIGYAALYDGVPVEDISAVFLDTPGSRHAPRSLYGVDWDLGDLLAVSYAGQRFDAEVAVVYVAIDENGIETVTGRNVVNASAD
jgi:hypothetical protein